jgi:hypothetical protein
MEKLNKKQTKNLILLIKNNVDVGKLKINTWRAIKEFLLKQENIYKYNDTLYFIENKWIYDITKPKEIQPLPNQHCLFCGFTDYNYDRYHYWLQDKKILSMFGITYEMYKNFKSINSFISGNKLYINNKYWEKKDGTIKN